jgi:ferric-dicitrate binding protein FerR (iron transport regulator)
VKPKKLWVSEKGGRWRSSTGSTSASAIGTLWQTTLLCEGTRVTVREGVVRVRDKARKRNRLVSAGQSFLVRTSGARRGQ